MENKLSTNFKSYYNSDCIHITQVDKFIDKGLYKFLDKNPEIANKLRTDNNFILTDEIFYGNQ